ncbi:MAG: hypothetical protein HON23_06265 [Rickettsiales bacterium]|jgi:chromosomal replication initiation ATPase DnaA|nr:hypothetical protein [Rickettsiales bacterium]
MKLLQYFLNFNRKNSFSDEFILGNHNIDAYNYLRLYPNWPNKILFINGPEGAGKSYICDYWKKLANASYINLFTETEKGLNTILENNDCFIIENIDIYFSRKFILRNLDNHDFQCFEKVIFKIMDHVITENKFLLISSHLLPKDMNIELSDLLSRLMSIATIKTHIPDEQTLKTFLIREFSTCQLKINNDLCDYILKKSVRSFDELHALVSKIDTLSMHNKRNITKPFIKEVMENEIG